MLIQQHRQIIKNQRKKENIIANKPRSKTVTEPNSYVMKKARELKTEQHHRLITRISAKTNELFESWNLLTGDENVQRYGQRVREK
jgi:hypothetical protein